MTAFAVADITVTNAQLATSLTGSSDTYSLSIAPQAEGDVTIRLNRDVLTDIATNPNVASNTLQFLFDTTNPGVTLSANLSVLAANDFDTNLNPVPINVLFTEEIQGLELNDFTVVNGTVQNLQLVSAPTADGDQPTLYTVDLVPTAETTLSLSMAAGRLNDQALNQNNASNTLTFNFDSTPPVPTLSTNVPGTFTKSLPIEVTITFTEEVVNFNQQNVSVTGGEFTAFARNEARTVFTGRIVPATEHVTITARVIYGATRDRAGNYNLASNTVVLVYDVKTPLWSR